MRSSSSDALLPYFGVGRLGAQIAALVDGAAQILQPLAGVAHGPELLAHAEFGHHALRHHAYKLKKPIRYDGIDFTTSALRRRNCEEEVRLNRRLAPDV